MNLYYLFIVLSVLKVSEECSSNESYGTTVQWQCGTGKLNQTNCDSLNDALNFTLQQVTLCSGQRLIASIYLNSATTTLSNSTLIEDVAQLRLLGLNNHTEVVCYKGAALKFAATTHTPINIEIHNVSFQKCGNGISALALSGKCNITFSHLKVVNSNGSGLLFSNISGRVNVSYSSFENNYLQSRFGAGVHMNFNSTQVSTIIFMHCKFSSNKAQMTSVNDLDLGGGGMCIAIGGNAKGTVINITDCSFSLNHAQRGAGLFASFSGNASCNRIKILRTEFKRNIYKEVARTTDIVEKLRNSGGGAMVITTASSYSNIVLFKNCSFSENQATWGGALELFSSPSQPSIQENVNHFTVANCTFKKNRGIIGSAISIYCKSSSTAPEFCSTQPLIAGESQFYSNGHNMTSGDFHFSSNEIKNPTSSILNINSFPTNIRGKISFIENIGSPLYVYETAVVIEEQSHLLFHNNIAQNGGGIMLYDSWMTVSFHSRLYFKRNKAYIDGGAIYAHQSKQLYVPYAHNCFIRYSNSTKPPWRWDSVFEFSGNIAGNETNSIYATSIIPCMWKYPNCSSFSENVRATFCWENWTFHDDNCTDQIVTSIRNFSTTPDSVSLSPGMRKQFIVGVDDLGHEHTKLQVIARLYPPVKGYTVNYTNEGLAVYGPRSNALTVLIQIDGDRTVFKTVNVTVRSCPPGFFFSSELSSCQCALNKNNFLICDDLRWKAMIMNGFCMSYSYSPKRVVHGRCIFTAIQRSQNTSRLPFIPLPADEKNLDKEFCGKFKRAGLLCGKCAKGLSIDVFSDTFDCYQCSSSRAKNWIIFLVVNGLPPLVMFIVILLLHISLTGGPTNGFIFFSQVITLSQQIVMIESVINATNLSGSSVLTGLIVDFYSIWSLDFYRIYHSFTQPHHPLCLGENFRVIDVLALQYFSALHPFFLIVMAYIIIELHARNCRIIACLWKPFCFVCTRFRLSLRARTSIVDAFAAFYILSYVKIVRISLLLITYSNIRTLEYETLIQKVSNYDPTVVFMSKEHMPYLIVGTFFLLTFGLLPPILLLFYQFRIVQRCLDRCKINRLNLGLKTFMDAVQGCYKDGRNGGPDRRFFAGIYLMLRIAMFLIFNMDTSHINIYLCLLSASIVIITLIAFLRPYKIEFYNSLDIFFACLLTFYFGLHIKGFSYLETVQKVPVTTILVANCLSITPLIYLIGFVVIKVIRQYCHPQRLRYKLLQNILRNTHQKRQCCSATNNGGIHPNQIVTYSEIGVGSIPDQLINSVSNNRASTSQQCFEENSRTFEPRYGSIN